MTRAWQADVFMLGLFTESQCENRRISAKCVGNIVNQWIAHYGQVYFPSQVRYLNIKNVVKGINAQQFRSFNVFHVPTYFKL